MHSFLIIRLLWLSVRFGYTFALAIRLLLAYVFIKQLIYFQDFPATLQLF